MQEDNSLDGILESDSSNKGISLKTKVKNYLVDCSSVSLFYTPLMTITECSSGMDSDEILTSRGLGVAAHFVIGRPIGYLRQKAAEYLNADANSSGFKKTLIDSSVNVAVQTPIYASMLYASGASAKEIAIALPSGIALGALTGRPFGYVQDKWRKLWGIKSVF